MLIFWHFIMEGIVAPTIRSGLRYKLFELRDKLRNQKMDFPDSVHPEMFKFLDEGINNSIKGLSDMTLYSLWQARKVLKSLGGQEFQEYNSHVQQILNSENQIVREVYRTTYKISFETLLVNSIVMVPYLLPILFLLPIVFVLRGVYKVCKNRIKRIVSYLPYDQSYGNFSHPRDFEFAK